MRKETERCAVQESVLLLRQRGGRADLPEGSRRGDALARAEPHRGRAAGHDQ